MKIYISADMEGVCGVTHGAQCRPSHPDYPRFRRLLTEEVNAAVLGALDGGATEILVNDSHFMMTNIVIEELHPRASLISGSNKLLAQMEGLDDSFQGVFFVGYHQGDGEGDGVINHTLMSATIRSVRVNGLVVDEAMINANVAGDFQVPVALVTGDDCVCATASQALPGVEVASVKRATDRLSAEHLPVEAARALIREKAKIAAQKLAHQGIGPHTARRPVRFEVEFRSSSSANMCTVFPNIERTGPCSIAFEQPSMIDAYKLFWGLGIVGTAVLDGVFGSGL
jgi:D-amino peptidase